MRVSWIEREKSAASAICARLFSNQNFSPVFLDLRNLAAELVDGWMAIIRSQSVSNNSPAGTGWFFLWSNGHGFRCLIVKSNTWYVCLEKKNKREESKAPNVKEKNGEEEKKKGKPKAHAPSHAKIRSIGRFDRRQCTMCLEWVVFKWSCILGCRAGDGHPQSSPC